MAPSDLASFLAGDTPADGPSESEAPAPKGAPSPAAAEGSAASARVILNDRYEIDLTQPLPDLGHAGADAFAAQRVDTAGVTKLFALVANSGLPARTDIVPAVRAIEHFSVMNLIGQGVAFWPPDGVERMIFIYERPAERLVASLDTVSAPMREDDVIRTLIQPVADGMEELKRLRVVHGAINPTNLFRAARDGKAVMIGDCLTAPTGYIQPAAFESIGRAMAEPAGRGIATHADDLYALGVSIIFLLLGRMPGGDLDDRALTAAKMGVGSFAALAGTGNLPQHITEPVRGLLMDNVEQRWTLDDLQAWLGGQRQSPRRAEVVGRLQRPVKFADQEYGNIRLLAAAMSADVAAADAFIEDGGLEAALARAVDDEDLMRRIEEAKRTASVGRAGSIAERRVARVLMVLDPQAPIRYRGRAVMPEGIGTAMAGALTSGRGMQELAEIVAAQLPIAWIGFQESRDEGVLPLVRQFDMLSGFVGESVLGYGVERCIYALDGSVPCASPFAEGRLVLDATALLHALEAVAGRSDRPKEPIDRHVAAFLMSRHARLIHASITVLAGDAPPEKRCGALVDLYDVIQRRTSITKLPKLCQWLAVLAESTIAGYHSRSLRDRLKQELKSVWKSGRVHDLKPLIADAGLSERDGGGFRAATAAHAQAGRRIAARRRELERKADIAGAKGRQAAAIVASLISVLMAVGSVIVTVF